jgi:isopenicillin N synthase-like dioxygenase
MAFHELPVVSLAGWSASDADRQAFADELRRICHEIGFLQLVDHGVDPAFVDDYFNVLQRFFSLPDEAKATIDKAGSPSFRGWERVGSELTDHAVDFREQVDVWTEHPPRDRDVLPPHLRLDGPNQ